jgi:hypothetical protein
MDFRLQGDGEIFDCELHYLPLPLKSIRTGRDFENAWLPVAISLLVHRLSRPEC